MRIAIYGTGAIGGLIGARLAAGGSDVVCIDRGPQLQALAQDGLTLIERDGERRCFRLQSAGSLADVAPPDCVVLAVKAHEIPGVAADIAEHSDTAPIVTVQNGLPWWYFSGLDGPHGGTTLESVDPGGAIGARIPAGRIVGCVAYPAAEATAPGVIRHVEGDRFPIGELNGAASDRARAISAELTQAGLKSPILDDVRSEIWLKAWGNLAFNPISALTGLTMAQICRFPPTRALATSMMLEAQTVAERLGITFRVPLERRLEGAERVGQHKTSMLQDLEHGRPLEIRAILSSVIEIGEKITGTPTPTLRAVEALVRAIDTGAMPGAQAEAGESHGVTASEGVAD